MTDDMVRCSACGTPHGSIEDATVCCEKVKPKKPIIECDVCDWWHDDAGCCRDDACLYEGADE